MTRGIIALVAVMLAACGGSEKFSEDSKTADAVADSALDTSTDVPADTATDTGETDTTVDTATDTAEEEPAPETGTISGTVYTPESIPGNFPMSNALVYVGDTAPAPIPDGVRCLECSSLPTGALVTRSGDDGTFTIADIDVGTRTLVTEKAGFRRVRSVTVVADTTVIVPEADTTLPGAHVPSAGDFTPSIALAMGAFDDVQDVLAKMGLCDLDSEDHAILATCDHIDIYDNGGGMGYPSFESLLRTPTLLDDYQVVMVPCSSGSTDSALSDPTVLANVRDWIAAGGRYLVADWSYDLLEQPLPDYIDFEGNDAVIGDADMMSTSYDVYGRADEAGLRGWITSSLADTPDSVLLEEVWDCVAGLGTVDTPTPGGGTTSVTPVTYTEAAVARSHACMTPRAPHSMLFQYGCGRVLYSTFHTVAGMGSSRPGLLLQEKTQIYMLFEAGLCI